MSLIVPVAGGATGTCGVHSGLVTTGVRRPAGMEREEKGIMRLGDRMEFDHVVTVTDAGEATDGPDHIHAPSLLDGELDDSRWELITHGYSSQDRYAGPVMHDCEAIGGRLERDILANPGIYVAIVASYTPEEESEEMIWEGWAVARLKGSESIIDTMKGK